MSNKSEYKREGNMNLKNEQDFEKYYEENYQLQMKRYYHEIRKRIIPKAVISIIVFIIAIVVSILLINYLNMKANANQIINDFRLLILGYFTIISIIFLFSVNKIAKKELKVLKETTYRDIVAFFEDANSKKALSYHANKRIGDDAINAMGLFNLNVLKCSGSDYTYVQYDNRMLCFSDLQFYLLEKREKEFHKNGKKYIKKWSDKKFIFDGIYIGFPLNQKNTSQIYLIPNNLKYTLLQSRIMDYIKYQGDQVVLNNSEFSKKYKVYSYNEEQTKQVLSLGLIEKINKLDELYKEKKYIVFKEGTRFSICIDGIKIKDIKEDIKFPMFRNKYREYKVLKNTFEEISKLFEIYHTLDLENN